MPVYWHQQSLGNVRDLVHSALFVRVVTTLPTSVLWHTSSNLCDMMQYLGPLVTTVCPGMILVPQCAGHGMKVSVPILALVFVSTFVPLVEAPTIKREIARTHHPILVSSALGKHVQRSQVPSAHPSNCWLLGVETECSPSHCV